eukprot:TRINITY_DN3974_c0_g4_i6.p3 TRINITY_DN3974_c0_g4~~TRINITY_DN3974_c0_g4_i6.p3  ORF type:complete len:139 (-),score=35.75 TRINITY_DN3974_c0_g4_i6:1101-1517(-)
MNGVDFTSDNEDTLFTFIGTGTMLNYWPYVVGIILGILAIIGLIMLLSWCWEKQKAAAPVDNEYQERAGGRQKQSGVKKKQAHTLRGDWGNSVPRGLFLDKDQAAGYQGERMSQIHKSVAYPRRSERLEGRASERVFG